VSTAAAVPRETPGRAGLSPIVVAAVALAVRAIAVLVSDRVVADVLRYRKVAAHVLDVSWNPYLAPRLYPYPAAWVWVEVAAEWLARHTGVSFALAVRAPVVVADALLAGIILQWARERGRDGPGSAWAYALHPVAILVVGFHGQFDSVALLALVCALRWLERGRLDRSALAFAAGIALKSFPVLVLPFALIFVPAGGRARIRYALLATVPVALLLLPFLLADRAALMRELFAYGGVPDFGWIGAMRAVRAVTRGQLARASAEQWSPLVTASKALFLAAAAALWVAVARGWIRWRAEASALGVLLAFQVVYGALSAQYLLWPVPLAVLLGERFLTVHAGVATLALVGFYFFLAPGVLTPADTPLLGAAVAERFWMVGTAALWLICAAWAVDLVRRGRSAE
jgi:uncharacterized membrane protein